MSDINQNKRYIDNERNKGTKDRVSQFQLREIGKNTLKAYKLVFALKTQLKKKSK